MFGREHRPNKLYRTMTWHDQIEVCTNAETRLLHESIKNCTRKNCTKLLTSTRNTNSKRLFNSSTVSHVSDENRRDGWCWLLYDEWNCEMAQLQQFQQFNNFRKIKRLNCYINCYKMLYFLIQARIAFNAFQTALHELVAPGLKVQSARKICAKTLLLGSCSVTFY